MYYICAGTWKKRVIRSPGTRVTGSCKLSFESWDLNLGPWEEHEVLLTAEPSLQPTVFHCQRRNNALPGMANPHSTARGHENTLKDGKS